MRNARSAILIVVLVHWNTNASLGSTTVIDSFDGPSSIIDNGGEYEDIFVTQRNATETVGGARHFVLSKPYRGTTEDQWSVSILDGVLAVAPAGGEGFILGYGIETGPPTPISVAAIGTDEILIRFDYLESIHPFPLSAWLVGGNDDIEYVNDMGGLTTKRDLSRSEHPFAVRIPLGEMELKDGDVGFSATISNIRGIGFYMPAHASFAISDIRIGHSDVEGDFDFDDGLDVDDIDFLMQQSRVPAVDTAFDLNHDGSIDQSDIFVWIKDLKVSWFGDADLNGEFNGSDLTALFLNNEYEDAAEANSTWGTGDWNGDAEFTSADLVLAFQDGGYEQGPRPSVSAVPEPSTASLILFAATITVSASRRKRL